MLLVVTSIFFFYYKIDSNYIQQNNINARNTFADIADRHSLVDVWRDKNPHKQIFTWCKQNQPKYGRLNMFFIQEHLRSHIISTDVLPGYRSDHSIINLKFKEPQKNRGPGLWKFNESLLTDEAYEQMVKKSHCRRRLSVLSTCI